MGAIHKLHKLCANNMGSLRIKFDEKKYLLHTNPWEITERRHGGIHRLHDTVISIFR